MAARRSARVNMFIGIVRVDHWPNGGTSNGTSTTFQLSSHMPKHRPSRTITTAKGKITYEEIDEKVFRPNNYRLVKHTYPVPTLEFIDKPSCAKKYSDNRAVRKPVVWDQITEWMKVPERNLSSISHYGQDAMAVHYALQDYPVTNMTGIVLGSEKPWVEVMALRNGAKELWTVEYQETKVVGTNQILIFNPIEFAERWKEYGDPVDPIGDLREIQKIACLLKPGALFYLAFERGQDAVLFNIHRVYGRMRLAMVMTGFEWVATYRGFSPYAIVMQRVHLEYTHPSSHPQDLFVLRKR
ncbi:hypothetical protein ANCCEY_03908 [Ancylostoma ceylanicum]|uniref:Uncharacterized protein n=1 Tax=Ancylostoma ceylanicum TaxID=53326 RepID=A0A0D6LY68_9BILA|nr:hypothetical protein ANCCEY_03908 [Ancylostoma ceylanicum]